MPRRRSARANVLILSAGFIGASRVAADAIGRHLRSLPDAVEVTTIDLFEETVPSLGVLARFAYRSDPDFFPEGVVTWSQLVEEPNPSTVVAEIEANGISRIEELLSRVAPDAIIATLPIAGALATHMRPKKDPYVSTVVIPSWDPRGTLVHPDTDLCFVASREARDTLVVAGLGYDRIAISGIPTCGTPSSAGSPDTIVRRERFTVVLDGPSGGVRDTADLALAIAASGVPVVLAPPSDERARRAFESAAAGCSGVNVADSNISLLAELAASGLLVAPADSGMLVEAMGLGRPAIVYAQVPLLEARDVGFLVNSGAVLLAESDSDVLEKVRFLYTHRERVDQMGVCASGLMPTGAAQIICERVLGRMR
jgi:hypothetical protein